MSDKNWRIQCKNSVDSFTMQNYASESADIFALKIPSFFASKINFSDKNDPILLQVLPHADELTQKKGYVDDPVGDLSASPSKGVIHKYHGRVLLIANGVCAVNCRYCFRRNFPYQQNYATENNWHNTIAYIKKHPEIHEVILSGGDPLMLSSKVLTMLSSQLEKIKHVQTLRIHTRLPIVTPARITTNFLTWLQNINLQKVMVVHCNHPQELDESHKSIFRAIAKTDTLLLNQSVLLKNINDDIDILTTLSHKLFAYGILPYYLNQLDKATGTTHFKVTNKKAIAIHKGLLKNLSGYLVPKLVQEISKKMHKTPLF
ncbi:MAG: EF-P beta-lysylation protein EpmB [Proteobacteria bacterium]|nr:EF-P beta-lysylation protein EpmB [Pseudomonadota bacterium]